MRKRIPTSFAVLALAGALVLIGAACGGGGKKGGSTGATKTMSPAAEQAQVKQVWTEFFAASTPAAKKIALLQHGSMFAPAIEAQSKSPLAKQSSATVSSVTVHGNKATVVYTVDLAGKPALKNQTGVALRSSSGIWQVGDASFCTLLKLGGKPPAACAHLG